MSRRSELLGAAFWAVAGAVILVASWRMDRLSDRGINPWSAPGLTPGVVGALMLLLALALAAQSLRRRPTPPQDETGDAAEPAMWRSAALALLLCLVFAGLSLGHGLPFVAEAALFIFGFTSVFSWKTWREQARVWPAMAQAAAVALVAAASISWLFESVFLVRLP